MASTIKVSMADLKVAKAPDSLTTLGLGSCIGLTLYDPASKIDRNTDMARHVLAELKIPLKAQDTGLNYGRTVILDCETGDYIIKAVGKEQKVI